MFDQILSKILSSPPMRQCGKEIIIDSVAVYYIDCVTSSDFPLGS